MTWQDIEGAKDLIIAVAVLSFIFTFWGIHKKESFIVSFLTSGIITAIISVAIYLFAFICQPLSNTEGFIEGGLAVAASLFFAILGFPILIIYILIGIICGSIPGASVACCLQKFIKKKNGKLGL